MTNGIQDYEGAIFASASSLVSHFNYYADKLQELQEKYEGTLNQDVSQINDILAQIQELNVSIRDADIRGDEALELRDQRNLLLDALSQRMKIDVTYSMEDAGAGLMVEKMTVTLSSDHKHTLVDGEFATKLSAGTQADGYRISLDPLKDIDGVQQDPNATTIQMVDNDIYGSLQSIRELLTEEGEYASADDILNDPQAAVKRGIPYYQKALDNLAREFAEQMNACLLYTSKTGINSPGDTFLP